MRPASDRTPGDPERRREPVRLRRGLAVAAALSALGGASPSLAQDDDLADSNPRPSGPATTPGRTAPPPTTQTAPAPAAPAPTTPQVMTGPPAANTPAPRAGDGEEPTSRDRDRTEREEAAAERRSESEEKEEAERAAEEEKSRGEAGEAPEADGAPSAADPTFALAIPGAAPIGVPDFFIEKFRIPPFLLPIYQAAGIEYGVRWEVLAAINEIETDYGRNLGVSSAGAMGWMQFIPSSWKRYGVDANRDGKKDPYNPVDAIFAAARYLKAAGADKDLRKAIFAYNHADWYVDSVLMRARLIGGLPADLVGSLTGLTQGRFPVDAAARYAGERGERGVRIYADAGAPVVAVQDGKVVNMGTHPRLGRFVQLEDTYGNTYTYGRLGELADTHLVPEEGTSAAEPADASQEAAPPTQSDAPGGKQRLHANPERPRVRKAEGSAEKDDGLVRRTLREGSRVLAGTELGRISERPGKSEPHVLFEIRPAGDDAPRIDPKPIIDGWKLLESTSVHRARGSNPLVGGDRATIGQILLLGKQALQKRVLENPRIEIYDCGRRDIRSGAVDRRVLATLEVLAASGLRPTVSSLLCGRDGRITSSGAVSHHVSGSAVDISKINGLPVEGHQGPGSVAEAAVRRLVTLQGTMRPEQIISLMTVEGAENTVALPDHHDHIHVGFRPAVQENPELARKVSSALKPTQWIKLIDRIGEIDNPEVSSSPSAASLPAGEDDAAGG